MRVSWAAWPHAYSNTDMKIEGYFQRQQTKPATADKPVSKQEAAERSKSKQGAVDGVRHTTPNSERDVDKVGCAIVTGGPEQQQTANLIRQRTPG